MHFLPLRVHSFGAFHYGNQLVPVQSHSIDFQWLAHAITIPNVLNQSNMRMPMDTLSRWRHFYGELYSLREIADRNTICGIGNEENKAKVMKNSNLSICKAWKLTINSPRPPCSGVSTKGDTRWLPLFITFDSWNRNSGVSTSNRCNFR